MPVVHIHRFPGKTKEQKNQLVKRNSKDFAEVANIRPESLNMLFHDTPKKDWGTRGSLASEQSQINLGNFVVAANDIRPLKMDCT